MRRERVDHAPQSVCLLTSRTRRELPPDKWLEENIRHWGIETGLHARLDASRHDDTCRLRNPQALATARRLQPHRQQPLLSTGIFQEKRIPPTSPPRTFQAHMGEEHDRRTIALVHGEKPEAVANAPPANVIKVPAALERNDRAGFSVF